MVALRGLRNCGFSCILLLAATAIPAAAQDIRLERDRFKAILRNVSKEIEKNFYDPELKGLDWKALTDQANQRIEQANSVSDMMTAVTVLVDKLKDSHTFFIPPPRPVKALFGFEAKPFGSEIRVFELKKDGAADRAGLQLGDRIYTINGFPAERKTFDLLMLYLRHLRPVQLMDIQYSRGGGTRGRLRIQAKVENEPITLDLSTLDSLYRLLQEEDPEDRVYAHTKSYNNGAIGYVKLKTFEVSTENAHNLVGGLKKSQGYIIDLRGNSGGALDALLAFVSHFGEQPGVMGPRARC